jgi:hypothetical protein
MQGSLLPIAILERKWVVDPITSIPALQMLSSGRLDVVGIQFDTLSTTNPKFKNKRGDGRFFCLFRSETLREELSVEVTAPSVLNVAKNRREYKRFEWEQPLTATFSGPSTYPSITVSATKQSRVLQPHSHIVFEWLTELGEDIDSILTVTGSADREWSLLVWRLLPDALESQAIENLNAFSTPIANASNANWSRALISRSDDWSHWYRVTNVSEANLAINWFSLSNSSVGRFRTQFEHLVKWRVRRSATQTTPAGGNIRLRIQKNGTDVATYTITIPTDESEATGTHSLAGNSFASGDTLNLQTDQCNPGEAFEIMLTFEVNR